jgi:hypothetical protein
MSFGNAKFVSKDKEKIEITINGEVVVLSVGDCITFAEYNFEKRDNEVKTERIEGFGHNEEVVKSIMFAKGNFIGLTMSSLNLADWKSIRKVDSNKCQVENISPCQNSSCIVSRNRMERKRKTRKTRKNRKSLKRFSRHN